MFFLEKLIPKSKKEKNAAFFCIVIALAIIALHNPFSGYQTGIDLDGTNYFPCNIGETTIGREDYSCMVSGSFMAWRAKNSAFPWLETLSSVLSLLSAVGGVYIALIVLFREENSTKNSS
jgi:hypothetical protein